MRQQRLTDAEQVRQALRALLVELLAPHVGVLKVGLDPKATPGYQLRPADGIVSYKLRLAPGEKRAVELHYYVDAPASMLGE